MKRLAVYSFNQTNVDEYVLYFIKAIEEFCHDIIFVTAKRLSSEDNDKLGRMGCRIVEMISPGTSANRYMKGLMSANDNEKYDEVVFVDDTFFGPIYPLDQVFRKMDDTFVHNDFWTITGQTKEEYERGSNLPGRIMPIDRQFNFLVLKTNVLSSEIFKNFFVKIPTFKDENDELYNFEFRLTELLTSNGFKYGSYISGEKLPRNFRPNLFYPYELIADEKSPILKKDSFTVDFAAYLDLGRGDEIKKTINYLESDTDYHTNLIWDHLLRTEKMSKIRSIFGLNYVLSSKSIYPTHIEEAESKKIAIIAFIYYKEEIDSLYSYLSNMNLIADLHIMSTSDEVLQQCRERFHNEGPHKIEFSKKFNKGRDVSAYLIEKRELFQSYDFICFIHDKRSPQIQEQYTANDFFKHCADNLLASTAFVANVISTFIENPRVGLLVPPPLKWGAYYSSEFWHENADGIRKLMKELHLTVPYDEYPVAPYGDMFWVRTEALAPLFKKNWTYNDLPDEPLPTNGTLLHALERIHPFVVQEANFTTAWLMSCEGASVFIEEIYQAEHRYSEEIFKVIPKLGFVRSLRSFEHLTGYLTLGRKAKIQKYRILNLVTLGLVPKFKKRLEYLLNDTSENSAK